MYKNTSFIINGEKMKFLFAITFFIVSNAVFSETYCFNKVEITSDYIFLSQSTLNESKTIESIKQQSLFLTTNPEVLRDISKLNGERFCVKGRVEHEKKEVELYVPCERYYSCRKVEFINRTIFEVEITQEK